MSESYRVIDDLLTPEQYAQVRQSALGAGFGNWTPAGQSVLGVNSFGGVGYMGDHATILEAIGAVLGMRLLPGEMKFRITGKDAAKAYIHADRSSGTVSAILYLSDDNDERSGTGFYRYKPNEHFAHGLSECPCYRDMVGTHWGDKLKADMTGENPEQTDKWEITSFVRAVPNRLLFFRSSLFHSRLPSEGIGDTEENSRLIWVAHAKL